MKLPGTDAALDERLAPLLVPIDDLQLDPVNPRTAKNVGALARRIARYGYTDPVVVNAKTKMVEAGHMRLAACRELGATHVPAVMVDHDDVTARAFNIAHNRSNEDVATWDRQALAELLGALKDEDGFDDIGFSGSELDALLGQFAAEEVAFPSVGGTVSDLATRTFTFSETQAAMVERALDLARARGVAWDPDGNNTNANGCGLAAICAAFVGDVPATCAAEDEYGG